MPDGRALIVSWIGLPDVDYPTDQYDYQGAMSLVKELTLKDGKLYQYPVAAMAELRGQAENLADKAQTNNTYELEVTVKANSKAELILFADKDGKGLSLTVDTENAQVVLDRSQAGQQYATEFGTSRSCQIDNHDITLNIFVDKSIVEIFINKGEKVFTSRVFPDTDQTGITVKSGSISGTYYELNY